MPNFSPAASADDATQTGSTMNLTQAGDISTGVNINGANHAGFRFPSVTIAQGSTVATAKIKLQLSNYSSSGFSISNTTLYGEKVANSAQFTTGANNITGRTRTTATQTSLIDTAAAAQTNGYDVASIVQEIVNQATWASGNALSLLFIGTGTSGARFIRAYMWDYFSGASAAVLEVTTGSASNTTNFFQLF